MVGSIRQSFDYLTEKMFTQLFKSMVYWLDHFWNILKGLESDLEDVQRRATITLSHLREKPYPERLRILKLPCLEHRRQQGRMIETYKYIHDIMTQKNPVSH